ncbi:MAG: PD-(D/E)XK nuclease family transposase [bacterium]|nr:PD-(D/E)XK nuclease family transposase [bacterium]
MPRKEHSIFDNYADLMPSFCLFDDLFMSICFNNDPLFTEQVLHVILNNNDLRVLEARTQVDLANLIGRSVRLDVKAQDAEGHPINIEIQRDSSKAVPRRARYHSSMLDAVTLKKQQDFKDLPECYVIFITEHDVLGKKLPIYHIDRVIKETSDDFDDGSHILYVNGENRDNTPLGRLMHDFFCTQAQNMYYNRLAEKVRFFKETEEGQKEMASTIEKIIAYGKADGIEIGRKEGRAEAIDYTLKALSLIKTGKYAIEEIASLSGLSFDEVKALQESIADNS